MQALREFLIAGGSFDKTGYRVGILVLLVVLETLQPGTAAERTWKRIDVLGGRATVEIPSDYVRASQEMVAFLAETFPSVDGFYKNGLKRAMRDELDRDVDDFSFPMRFGSEDSMGHVWVVENAGPHADIVFDVLCPSNKSAVETAQGLHVVTLSADREVSFCGGIMGAAAFLACPNKADRTLCVLGMDYVEFYRLEEAGESDIDSLDPEAAWQKLHASANGDVIEHVLRSFRMNE